MQGIHRQIHTSPFFYIKRAGCHISVGFPIAHLMVFPLPGGVSMLRRCCTGFFRYNVHMYTCHSLDSLVNGQLPHAVTYMKSDDVTYFLP